MRCFSYLLLVVAVESPVLDDLPRFPLFFLGVKDSFLRALLRFPLTLFSCRARVTIPHCRFFGARDPSISIFALVVANMPFPQTPFSSLAPPLLRIA